MPISTDFDRFTNGFIRVDTFRIKYSKDITVDVNFTGLRMKLSNKNRVPDAIFAGDLLDQMKYAIEKPNTNSDDCICGSVILLDKHLWVAPYNQNVLLNPSLYEPNVQDKSYAFPFKFASFNISQIIKDLIIYMLLQFPNASNKTYIACACIYAVEKSFHKKDAFCYSNLITRINENVPNLIKEFSEFKTYAEFILGFNDPIYEFETFNDSFLNLPVINQYARGYIIDYGFADILYLAKPKCKVIDEKKQIYELNASFTLIETSIYSELLNVLISDDVIKQGNAETKLIRRVADNVERYKYWNEKNTRKARSNNFQKDAQELFKKRDMSYSYVNDKPFNLSTNPTISI